MKISFLLCLLLFVGKNLLAQENCPSMSGFAQLQEKIIGISAEKQIAILNKYLTDADFIAACQTDKIEAILDKLEKPNFTLSDDLNKHRFSPQIVIRCNQFNPVNGQCSAPNADDTMRYHLTEKPHFLAVPEQNADWQFSTNLKGYKLIAVYQASMQSASSRAQRLSSKIKSSSLWPATEKKHVLTAIYKTSGPWRYRKIVWYFE